MPTNFMRVFIGAIITVITVGLVPALSQPNPNLAGQTVQMIIGIGVGGGYDAWGRLVARHIGKHLPGKPNVVPQNMPGAGSYVAASYIYNVAPKDGTVLGIIARDAALGPLAGAAGAQFDPLKLSWVGTPTTETNVCIANNTAQVKNVDDLYTKELIVGDTGAGTGNHLYPKALKGLLGMKFKTIGGFPSASNIILAIERGEVDGICETFDILKSRRPNWISEGKINILFQGGSEPNPEIKDVPFIVDLGKTAEQKQALQFLYAGQGIGRPFIAPPGMSADRLKMLRDAFSATMKDPEFLADAEKQKFDVKPRTGEELTALIKQIYDTPKPVIEKVGEIIK